MEEQNQLHEDQSFEDFEDSLESQNNLTDMISNNFPPPPSNLDAEEVDFKTTLPEPIELRKIEKYDLVDEVEEDAVKESNEVTLLSSTKVLFQGANHQNSTSSPLSVQSENRNGDSVKIAMNTTETAEPAKTKNPKTHKTYYVVAFGLIVALWTMAALINYHNIIKYF